MIFALANVPLVYQGQEVSAQDLNNLAQNTEVLEQIVRGPSPLFLSNWKLAPPSFFLTSAQTNRAIEIPGEIKVVDGQTVEGKTTYIPLADQVEVEEVDMWSGAFIFREGMHTLRLGFQTYPLIDDVNGNNQFLPINKVGRQPANASESISLFLVLRYTDVPTSQLLSNSLFKNYARSWVYWNADKSKYKQPHNSQLDSYTFDQAPTADWKPNAVNGIQLVDGYAEYTLDLTQFNFVHGEIVTLKFRLALRDGTKLVSAVGRHFYFSMVYANIDHNLHDTEWVELPTITDLSQLSTMVSNQAYLVNFFKKYDNPLRASLWDQILTGGSYFPIHTDDTFTFTSAWGMANAIDMYYHNTYAQEARYYAQKNLTVHDTITVSFLLNVNSTTAATLQGIWSNTANTAMSYRYPYVDPHPTNPAVTLWNAPFQAMIRASNDTATGYNGTRELGSHISRGGLTYGLGSFVIGKVAYSGLVSTSGVTEVGATNQIPLREALFMKKTSKFSSPFFGGFWFIRPSPIDGGVTYYSQKSGLVLGTATQFFYGPRTGQVSNNVGTYADTFNFTLVPQSGNSNRYYPGLYGSVFSGLSNHSSFYIENNPTIYTDFSVDLKESSGAMPNPSTPFAKASYISTIRIAEVSKKSSSFTVTNFTRFTSFQDLSYSGLIAHLNQINTKLNTVKTLISLVDEYKYIPIFWQKPKSMLIEYERIRLGERDLSKLRLKQLEELTVYFSKLRQADYLVVRGKNISIGWAGFNKLYRDNPNDIFPAPLTFEFVQSQTLTGNDIQTVVLGFASLPGLNYGERYYLTGDIYYAAETMGVP